MFDTALLEEEEEEEEDEEVADDENEFPAPEWVVWVNGLCRWV